MFIDIHGHAVEEHFCNPTGDKPIICEPEELLAIHDKLGIESAVLMPFVNAESFCTQSNEEAMRIASRYPGRFIPFCNVDPRSWGNSWKAPLGDVLKYYRDKGYKGLGEVCANLKFLDPRVQNLFKGCEEAGLPLLFHMSPFEGYDYGLADDPGLPQLEECLRRFPKLRILGHSQTFWSEIADYRDNNHYGPRTWIGTRFGWPTPPIEKEGRIPELMRKYPNLYGDLSAGSGFNALNRDLDYAVSFLNEFQDRLLFGTDICIPPPENYKLAGLLTRFRDERKISQEVFRKIAHDNAVKILEL